MDHQSFSLKPMTVGGILDTTFQIYRNNFITILAFSALISGIFDVLQLTATLLMAPTGALSDPWGILITAIKSGNPETFLSAMPTPVIGTDYLLRTIIMSGVAGFLGIVGSLCIIPFVQGGIIHITQQYLHGKSLDVKTAFQDTIGRFGKLVLTALSVMVYYIAVSFAAMVIIIVFVIPLVFLGIAMGNGSNVLAIVGFIMLLIVFIFVMVALFLIAYTFISFVYPVAITEGLFHFNAIGRSFKLVSRNFWKVLGVNLLAYLLVYLVIGAISAVAFTFVMIVPAASIFQQILTLLVTALVLPITYIVITVLYYDVRIRSEGYDIEVMTQRIEG